MKKIVLILACFTGIATIAQNIPADSLDYYRKTAHRLYIDNRMDEAVELYKKLALSGDALSGYQLHEIYSQGKGVPKDPQEAEKWRSTADETLALKFQQSRRSISKTDESQHESDEPQSLEGLFHASGSLIEKGAREKNAAITVGLAGAGAGIVLIGIGSGRQAESMGNDGTGAVIAGYSIMGACAIAALVVNMVGNKHIKQGGELMRRVKISGEGVTVKF